MDDFSIRVANFWREPVADKYMQKSKFELLVQELCELLREMEAGKI